MKEVKSTWRTFDVSIVPGLPSSYVIQEKERRILICRSYLRPWRMLAALIDAMVEVAELDDTWAKLRNRNECIARETVLLAGEKWTVASCFVLVDFIDAGKTNLKPFEIDYDKRVIRINTRFNAGFTGPALIQAVGEICADRVIDVLEMMAEKPERAALSPAA